MEVQDARDVMTAIGGNDVTMVTDLIERGFDINQSLDERGTTTLYQASEDGQLDSVQLLLKYGANVNGRCQNGMTPLHAAVRGNHVTIARCLLEHGADLSAADVTGHTPLTLSLNLGNKIISSLLINQSETMRRGQGGRFHRDRKMTPLHLAVKNNDVRTISEVIDKLKDCKNGRDASFNLFYSKIHEPTRNGFTPLHTAAQFNSKEAAKLLINSGANVNFPAKHSVTPLHVACRWGHSEMVNLLLSEHANIESCTKDKLTPLHCACRNGHADAANILLKNGAKVLSKTKSCLSPLHMAAQADHVVTCELLLHYFSNINDATYDYLTPLHVAAHCGNYSVSKFLLNSGCFVDARARNGFTPLHVACRKNRRRIVELLLRFHADIEADSESGLTPLHVSSFLGHLEIVRLLLDVGAHIDSRNLRFESPIHLATKGGNLKVVELLLERDANVDSQAKELQTPLHVACHSNHLRLIELLIDKGASLDPYTTDQHTPLHLAAIQDNEDAILCLMRRGADATVLTKRGFSALHLASRYNKKRSVRMLLAGGCDPNVKGMNELTPLLLAAHYGHLDVVRMLLKYGADVGLAALNGYNGLHISAKRNRLRIAEELIKWGIDVNSKSKNGFTALHIASREGHELMVQMLLNNGSEVNCPSKNGLTPMHLAAKENRVGVAKLLVLYKAHIDPQTTAGHTPLHVACHFGQSDMIHFLLSHNADPNSQNKHGFTPLHQAAQEGHVMVINMLLKFKANPNVLSYNGRSAYSIARHLNYTAVIEALRGVTKKHQSEIMNINEESFEPCVPETMQDYDIMYLDETYDKKGIYSQLDGFTYDIVTSLKRKNGEKMTDDGKTDQCSNQSPSFMVDDHVIVNELKYTSETFHVPTAGTTPSDDDVIVDDDNDCPTIGSQFCDCMDMKSGEKAPISNGPKTYPHQHCGKIKPQNLEILKNARGKSEPIISIPDELSCQLLHPSELPNLPIIPEDQAMASWVVCCHPPGKTYPKPVAMVVPHFVSLVDEEREVAIYESNNGLDWLEHVGPEVTQEKDCIAILRPTFRGVSLQNDLYNKHLIVITALTIPRYMILISRQSESRLQMYLPGSILRPPSDKHPVFITIGQHTHRAEELSDLSLSARHVPHEIVLRSNSDFTPSACINIKPLIDNFKCPMTLTLSCFDILNSLYYDRMRLYVNQYDSQWFDITDVTEFVMNESNTVVSFPVKHGGRYIMTNKETGERSLNSIISQLNLVPFHATYLLFCRISPANSGYVEFDIFCGTGDVIDGFVEEENHLKKFELFRSEETEVYHNTFQVFKLEGAYFQVCEDSPDSILFHAFQKNCVTVMAKILDHHLLEKDITMAMELFSGLVTISSLVPTDDQVLFATPICQSKFSFTRSDDIDRVLWYPFIDPSISHREQLPPIANFCPSSHDTPVKINFDEYEDTIKLPQSTELIRYDYLEDITTDTSVKCSETSDSDGSINVTQTATVSTFKLIYRLREGDDSKELVEKKLAGMEVTENISKFPPGLKADEQELENLKFITFEKNEDYVDDDQIPIKKKVITKIYQSPKPKVTKTFTEGETITKTSFEEGFQKLEDGSAIKNKTSTTTYIKPVSENTFINGVLKNSTPNEIVLRNEIENYSLKLKNRSLTPKLGIYSIDVSFKQFREIINNVEEIKGELMVELVPGALAEFDDSLKFENKRTKIDMITRGPVECNIEKMNTSSNLDEYGRFVMSERTIMTYVLPCYEIRLIALSEKKKLIKKEVVEVQIIDNIIELPPNHGDIDYERFRFDTKGSFSEETLPSGIIYKKKTFVTKLLPIEDISRQKLNHSILCPIENRVRTTGLDKYSDIDDVYEFNRTVETSLVQPVANFVYNRSSIPIITINNKNIETDVMDLFMRLECGDIEKHASNCDISIIIVPNAPSNDAKISSIKRVVYDVRLKPPRVIKKQNEGDVQVKSKMEEFVKVSDDGKSKSHFKVVTSEHYKPITTTTQVDGEVTRIEKHDQLISTNVRENIFEMPINGADMINSNINITTTGDKLKDSKSDCVVNKSTTKISMIPCYSSNIKKSSTDKCKEPEILKEEYEFEDQTLDGTINKHFVTIETIVANYLDEDRSEMVEQKVTEKILEIPLEVRGIDESQLCTRTTDSWTSDKTSAGLPRTKHVIRIRLCNKLKNFDYDPISRNSKIQEELEGQIQMKIDVQEFEKFSNNIKMKHKVITKKYLKPVTIVKYEPGKKIPEITVREDLMKVEIEEYAMELDDELNCPDDCVSTIENYTYVNYLPNGIPVNTEVTKITAKLKKENKLQAIPLDNIHEEKYVKQNVNLNENQEELPDGSIKKTKIMTKDCFDVHKKVNTRGEATIRETLLKTDIKEFIIILPKGKIDIYAVNCCCEINSEFNRTSKKGEPIITKLLVKVRVSLKANSNQLILNYNEIPKYLYAVAFDDTIRRKIVEYDEKLNDPCVERIKKLITIKSRPYYTLELDDDGVQHKVLSGNKIEEIETIECILECLIEDIAFGYHLVEIKSCKSEESNSYENGIVNKKIKINCTVGKADSDSAKHSWVLEEKIEKKVEVLKEEDDLLPNGSLKRTAIFAHKYFKIINTIKLSPELFLELETSEKLLECNRVVIDVILSPSMLCDENDYNVEMRTSNDWEEISDNTRSQNIEMCMMGPSEFTYREAKLVRKTSEDEKETFMSDGKLMKLKTSSSQTSLNFIECRKQENKSETALTQRNVLLYTNIFTVITEIGPEIIIDELKQEFESILSKDRSYSLQSDGSLCHKNIVKFSLKKAEQIKKQQIEQHRNKKSTQNNTSETLEDGTIVYKSVNINSTVKPYYKIAHDQQLMLNEDVLSDEIDEVIFYLKPELKVLFTSAIPIQVSLQDGIEISQNKRIKRREIRAEISSNDKHGDQIVNACGNLESEDDVLEHEREASDKISKTKTWIKTLFKQLTDIQFDKKELIPILTSRRLELHKEKFETFVQIPLGLLNAKKCDVFISFESSEKFYGVLYAKAKKAAIELVNITESRAGEFNNDDKRLNIVTDSNESGIQCRKSEVITTEVLPDGSLGRKKITTTTFFKKRLERTLADGIEISSKEEDIPVETSEETHLLHLPFEMNEADLNDWDTEVTEVKDEGEKQLAGLNMKYRTVHLKLVPRSGRLNAAEEVSEELVEGEIQPRENIEETQEALLDGSILKKKIITTHLVKPLTKIISKNGKVISSTTSEQLVGREVEEIHIELPAGHIEPFGNNLITETSVDHSDEVIDEQSIVKKKIIKMRITLQDSETQSLTTGAQTDFPCLLNSNKRLEGDIVSSTSFSEKCLTNDDGERMVCKITTTRFFRPVVEIVISNGSISTATINEETTHFDVCETVTIISPGVENLNDSSIITISTEEVFNEKNQEGIPILRTVKTNKLFKVMGPMKMIEPQSPKGLKSTFPQLFLKDNEVDDSIKIYSQVTESEPTKNIKIQEFVDTLPDGTKVKRRITETVEKRTITKKLAIEGGERINMLNGNCFQNVPPILTGKSSSPKDEQTEIEIGIFPHIGEIVCKKLSRESVHKNFTTETTFASIKNLDDANDFYEQ